MKPNREREQFEAWANAKGTFGNSWNGEFYENKLHQAAWQGYQAALSDLRPYKARIAELERQLGRAAMRLEKYEKTKSNS